MVRKQENFQRVHVIFQNENYEDIGMQIVSVGPKGERLVATSIKFEVRELGKEYGATALLSNVPSKEFDILFGKSSSQDMVDKLIELGVKPTQLSVKEELIKSLKSHLEDMRQIVFGPGGPFSYNAMKIDPDKVKK